MPDEALEPSTYPDSKNLLPRIHSTRFANPNARRTPRRFKFSSKRCRKSIKNRHHSKHINLVEVSRNYLRTLPESAFPLEQREIFSAIDPPMQCDSVADSKSAVNFAARLLKSLTFCWNPVRSIISAPESAARFEIKGNAVSSIHRLSLLIVTSGY